MTNNCCRCWKRLSDHKKLWCEKCVELVKSDLRWEIDHPYRWYFKHYYKVKWKTVKSAEKKSTENDLKNTV